MPVNPIARMTSPESQNVFAAPRPRKSVRRLPQFLFATLIVVALACLGLSLARGRVERAVDEAQRQRHELFLILNELRQTSDELTRMARTFVVTGKPVYEEYFNEILATRDGRKPRPAHYDKVYWDLVIANGQPASTGPVVALDTIIARAGFTAEERAKLEALRQGSDQLALLERMAMNAAKGVYRDSSGQFSRRGAPDQSYATRILHGAEYHQGRARVMWLLHQTQLMVDQRTRAAVDQAGERLRNVARLETGLIGVAVLLLAASFILLNRQLIEPILQLSATSVAVGRNGFFRRVLVERDDELGSLAGALNRMSETVEEKVRELEASEERSRQLLAVAPDALIISDGGGRVTALNQRAATLLGFECSAVEGRPLATLLPGIGEPDPARRTSHTSRLQLSTGEGQELTVDATQNVIERPDGSLLVCTALRDATAGKEVDEELIRQTGRQKAALAALPHPVFFTDESDRITAINPAFEKVFGLASEAVTGKSLLDLDFLPEVERRQIQAALNDLASAGTRIDRELPVIGRDGFEQMMQLTVEAVRSDDDSPAGAVALLVDITDRRRLETDRAAVELELTRSRREVAEVQAVLAQARDEAALLRESLADARAVATSVGAELEGVRSQLADACATASEAETRAAELKRELDEANARLVDFAITQAQGTTASPAIESEESAVKLGTGEGDDPVEEPPTGGEFEAEMIRASDETEADESTMADPNWDMAALTVADPIPNTIDTGNADESPAYEGKTESGGDSPAAEESIADEPTEVGKSEVTSVSTDAGPATGEASSEAVTASGVDPTAASSAPPRKRKSSPRKKKEKADTQTELFAGSGSAGDDMGPVRVTFDLDGVPVVSGLDFREAINRLELPVEAVVRMLIQFAEGLPETCRELRTELAAGDTDAARRHAHGIAGTAGSLSADTLRRLAKTLELALKFEQGDASRMLAEVEHEAGRIIEAARQLAAYGEQPAAEPAVEVSAAPAASRKLWTTLEELASVLDEGEIETIGQAVARLKSAHLPEALQADYERLSEMIDNFEYADAAGIVRSMMERLR